MFILRSIRLTQSLPKQAYRYTSPARNMTGLAGLLSNRYKVEDIPDQTGKVAIVTGGSAGIGQQIVNDLVQKGAEVHIISATREHAEETIEKISKNVPDASSKIHHHAIDLGNLQSIVDLLPKLQSLPRIDQLYLIAGVGVAPFGLTKDGLGNHFAVNHLSHFLLVDGLLPKLKETSESKQSGSEEERFSTRIITESSELHRTARAEIKCDSVEEFNQEDDANRLYARSKLLGIWFTKQLAQHLPPLASSSPILAIAVHPGAVATEQQKGATEAYGLLGKALEVAAAVGFMSPEQGSESALWAGTAPAVAQRREEAQGAYFTEADGKVGTETAQAQEAETARKLWDLSVKVLKDKLNYEVKM